MPAALVAGERDPEVLAQPAKGLLRKELPVLRQALRDCFSDHHALLIGLCLDHLTRLEAAITRLDERPLRRAHQRGRGPFQPGP